MATKMSSTILTVLTLIVRAAECQFTGPKCYGCSVTKGNANDLIDKLASVATLGASDADRPNMPLDKAKLFRERDFQRFLLGSGTNVTLCTDGNPAEVRCIDTLYACGTVTENKKVRARGCISVPGYFERRTTFDAESKKAMYSCWYVDEAKVVEFCACSHAPNCNNLELVSGARPVISGPVCYQNMLIMSANVFILLLVRQRV